MNAPQRANSLNRIVLLIQNIVLSHQMKPSFGYGHSANFNASNETFFPAVWLERTNSSSLNTVQGIRVQKISFYLYVLDRLDKGDGNMQDIDSDTLYILNTLLAFIRESQYARDNNLILDSSDTNIQPVTWSTDENCDGYRATITFRVPMTYTPCDSPIVITDQIVLSGATAGSLSGFGSYFTQFGGALKFQYDYVDGDTWQDGSSQFPYPAGSNNISLYDGSITLPTGQIKVRLRNIDTGTNLFRQAYSNEIIIDNGTSGETIELLLPIVDCVADSGWNYTFQFNVTGGSGTYSLEAEQSPGTFSVFAVINGPVNGTVIEDGVTFNFGHNPSFPVVVPVRVRDGATGSYVYSNVEDATFNDCDFLTLVGLGITCNVNDTIAVITGGAGNQSGQYQFQIFVDGSWITPNGWTFSSFDQGNIGQTINLSNSNNFDIGSYSGESMQFRLRDVNTGFESNFYNREVPACQEVLIINSMDNFICEGGLLTGTVDCTITNITGAQLQYFTGFGWTVLGVCFDGTNILNFSSIVGIEKTFRLFNITTLETGPEFVFEVPGCNITELKIDDISETGTFSSHVFITYPFTEPDGILVQTSGDNISWADLDTVFILPSNPYEGILPEFTVPGLVDGNYYRIGGKNGIGNATYSNSEQLVMTNSISLNCLAISPGGTQSDMSISLDNIWAYDSGHFIMEESLDGIDYLEFAQLTMQQNPWTITFGGFQTNNLITDQNYYRLVGKNAAGDNVYSNEILFEISSSQLDSITKDGLTYSVNVSMLNAYEFVFAGSVVLYSSPDGNTYSVNFELPLPSVPYTGTASYEFQLPTQYYYKVAVGNQCGVPTFSNAIYVPLVLDSLTIGTISSYCDTGVMFVHLDGSYYPDNADNLVLFVQEWNGFTAFTDVRQITDISSATFSVDFDNLDNQQGSTRILRVRDNTTGLTSSSISVDFTTC